MTNDTTNSHGLTPEDIETLQAIKDDFARRASEGESA